ncbi:MAG: energy-coupling factor transporter ATPase [Bacillota bacterium]|nr:energy-coupling factor transporter ATPase [Bacillota bacterium]
MVRVEQVFFTPSGSKTPILSGVDFELQKGECLLLCGRSGGGKTSISKLINALIPKFYDGSFEGKVEISGLDTSKSEIFEVSRFVSSVFQNPKTQFFNVSTTEEILFYLENRGFPRAFMKESLQRTASELRIHHLLNRNIFELSGGEKQIIAIASAYASGAEIVVLDEPSSNLDGAYIDLLRDALRILKKNGRTLIIAEHRFYYLAEILDRVFYVEDGKITRMWTGEAFRALDEESRKRLGLRDQHLTELQVPDISSASVSYEKSFVIRQLDCVFRRQKTAGIFGAEEDSMESADALKKRRRRGVSIDNVAIPLGSVVGIVGKNGVGKSTLIRTLLGLEKGMRTEVEMAGKRLSGRQRVKKGYLVMQDVNHQLFSESVESEVELGKSPRRTPEEVRAVMERLNIYDLKEKHPLSLSGGQKQRVAVASAILSDADLVCFDEPTSGMDYENMLKISKLVRESVREDNVVLIISHDIEFLNETVDYIIDLEDYPLRKELGGGMSEGGNVISKILSYAKDRKKNFYFSMVLLLFSTLSWVGAFIMTYLIADGVIQQNVSDSVMMYHVAGLLVCMVLYSTLRQWGLKHSHIFAYHALAEIRKSLTDKMKRNPLGTTLGTSAGVYRTKLVDSVEQIEILLAHGFPEGVPYIMGTVAVYVMLFVADYRMGFLALVPLVLSMYFMGRMFRNSTKKMIKYYESSKNMSANIVDYIRGIEVIKIFNRHSSSYRKLTDSVYEYRDFTLGWFRESWNTMAFCSSMSPTVILLVLPFGILFLLNGSITLSKLVLVSLLCFAAATPVTKLQFFMPVLAQLNKKISDLEQDFFSQELKTGQEVLDARNAVIEFDRVRFSYKETEVIKGASFHFQPGQKVALVGESGSGKSTLAKLLLHYYDIDDGEIRIGGRSLTSYTLESLMNNISYVSQDNFLFDMSIRDNILLGNPDASEEELFTAAKAAHIHDFILSLEQGYETKAGDSGNKLSGGEKQRICIARAIIKNAPIVILDEATSYTDPENEYYIDKAIGELLKDRTVIIIAHKLSKIMHSDQIILVDDGNILATGTHEELLQNEVYSNLWNRYISAKTYEFSIGGGTHV